MIDSGTNEARRCPQCGVEFVPASSPLGLCPACLLKLGASDSAMTPPPESENIPAVAPLSAIAPPSSRRRLVPWSSLAIVTGLIVLLLAAVVALRLQPRSSDTFATLNSVIRFGLPLPDETDSLQGAQFAVSPDGAGIVLAARGTAGTSRLWIRLLQSMEWRELARTDGATLPFWSPDSRDVGFFAEKKLKRIDISNGLTQTLCDAPAGRGGTWGIQGVIVFAPAGGPLFRVAASGGTPQPATTLDQARGEAAHSWPHFLPDGQTVLFVTSASGAEGNSAAGLSVVSLDSGRRRLLMAGAGRGAFAEGYLLFARGSELQAGRFDADRAELRDDVRSISGAEHVGDPSTRSAGFSVSGNGVLIHQAGNPRQSQLFWFDRTGRILGEASEPANYQHFSLSPDGRRVAIARHQSEDASPSIWLIDLFRQASTRLTVGPTTAASPLWSPDGRHIVFVSRREGTDGLYVMDADRAEKEQVVLESQEAHRPTGWSPDGRWLLYSTESSSTGSDLWILPFGGDQKPQPFLKGPSNESDGHFSPDGRWIAYVSDESGRDEVYVRAFPQPEGRWQISSGGGTLPKWRGDGRELFFVADGKLMSVDIQLRQEIKAGTPRALFPFQQADEYAVSPDGHRFLVKMPVRNAARESLQVVLNWTSELRR